MLIKEYVKKHFPKTALLNYAEQVEAITTTKKPNLILNVDGVIAVAFVDLLRESVSFDRKDKENQRSHTNTNRRAFFFHITGCV